MALHPDSRPPENSQATPWWGFASAAEAAVRQLNRSVPGMDLWLATHVVEDRQIVVASAGAWAQLATKGTAFAWQASFCAQMVRRGPSVACDVEEELSYRGVATGPLAKVRAYLGVPLLRGDDELFGTLCAFAGSPRPPSLSDGLPTVTLVGRLLGSVLSGERTAHERSEEAAKAYALAQRDPVTGLPNRRGWEQRLQYEQERCARYGTRASVLVVRVDDLTGLQDRSGHEAAEELVRRLAGAVSDACPRCDVVAMVERDALAVLSVETDLAAAEDLAARLRRRLRSSNLSAALGVASRGEDENLVDTWARAALLARAEPQWHRGAVPRVSRRAR